MTSIEGTFSCYFNKGTQHKNMKIYSTTLTKRQSMNVYLCINTTDIDTELNLVISIFSAKI